METTNQIETIKEVKSEINNRFLRVRKVVIQGKDYYLTEYKTQLGWRYCESTSSKEEMENNFSFYANQILY